MPSLHYRFAVNGIFTSTIRKSNALATKFVKSWLGLTRSTSVAVIHHPSILNIPFLSDYSTKAKLSFLSAVTTSKDPLIEIASVALSPSLSAAQCMLEVVGDVLSLAIESVEAINKKTLPRAVKAILKDRDVHKWNLRLQELSVQCKFKRRMCSGEG